MPHSSGISFVELNLFMQRSVDGRIVHTPGHSIGSVTVLLDSGAAYIGDLCYNAFPFHMGPIRPLYADDVPVLYASWRKLLATNATRLYPAHGQPFAVGALRAAAGQQDGSP